MKTEERGQARLPDLELIGLESQVPDWKAFEVELPRIRGNP